MGILESSSAGIQARTQLKSALQSKDLYWMPFKIFLAESVGASMLRQGFSFVFGLPGLRNTALGRFLFSDTLDFQSDYFQELKNKIARLRTTLDYKPKKLLDYPLMNRLGLQPLRLILHRLSWLVRGLFYSLPKEYEAMGRTLAKDGILVIEDYLSEKDFAQLEQYIQSHQDKVFTQYTNKEKYPCSWDKAILTDVQNDLTKKYFSQSPFVKSLVEFVTHRKIRKSPEFSFFRWACPPEHLGKEHQYDVEDIIHFDVGYPTIKIFYYLTDTDENNAAFVFAKGTHRLTWERLKYEYWMSNNYFGKPRPWEHLILDEKSRQAMKVKEQPIRGKKNTLIIANVMGFHRRHEALNTKPRELLFLNYRYLESLAARFL